MDSAIPAIVLTAFGLAGAFQLTGPAALDATGPISYYIQSGEDVAGRDPVDGDLARMAFDAWSAETGGRVRFVEAESPDDARIRLIWVAASSGLYGQARPIVVDGRRGAEVFVTPEVSALGSDVAGRAGRDALFRHTIVYLTCVHELGHALGLPHTARFEDIMYSFGYGGDIVEYFMRYRRNLESIEDIGSHSGLSDGDRAVLGGLYPP